MRILSILALLASTVAQGASVAPKSTASSLATWVAPPNKVYTSIGPTPLNPWNVQLTTVSGDPQWLRFECRDGDRRTIDSVDVERVRADITSTAGKWSDDTSEHVIIASEIYDQNTAALVAGDYQDTIEEHSDFAAGDVGGAGPFAKYREYSAGAGGNIDRIELHTPIVGTGGLITGYTTTILWQGQLSEGVQYNWIFRTARGSNGHVFVWLNGTQIVNYVGPYGYGTPGDAQHRTWGQFGCYRHHRADTTILRERIYYVTP